jgi:hypothetical protein
LALTGTGLPPAGGEFLAAEGDGQGDDETVLLLLWRKHGDRYNRPYPNAVDLLFLLVVVVVVVVMAVRSDLMILQRLSDRASHERRKGCNYEATTRQLRGKCKDNARPTRDKGDKEDVDAVTPFTSTADKAGSRPTLVY